MHLSKPPRIKSPQRKKKRNDCGVNWEQSAAGAANQTQLWQQPSLSWAQNILYTSLSLSFTPFIDSARVHPILNLARHLLSNTTREKLHRLWRNKQSNNLKPITVYVLLLQKKTPVLYENHKNLRGHSLTITDYVNNSHQKSQGKTQWIITAIKKQRQLR